MIDLLVFCAGEGSFGSVYRCSCEGHQVAVKILSTATGTGGVLKMMVFTIYSPYNPIALILNTPSETIYSLVGNFHRIGTI